ncbi:restriction endonuclease subunit S [Marinobacter litoralis]|uniref:restriction endonuclease subunit S n=1 Tax=Marinobacter litoralis TaxID=187981 RepID=UPI0018EA4EC6|nr:restriction endonuclease subunit S [Marinobacter litoralis]MBJ6137955.1 restriction endonuclease subunit S [Marinobacter litoralis]
MTWPVVRLDDVAQINPRLPKNIDDSRVVSFVAMASAGEDGMLLNEEPRILAETKKGFTYFENRDVLLAKITPCFENGKCLRPGQISNQVGFGSTEFHVLRADEKLLDPSYLFYMIWSKQFRFLGEPSMSGAAGQKRVSTDFLKGFEVPLPPLVEQKRIVSILDKADDIRRKRQQAIQLADEFLRAVFLDMFGDPVTNPKGWELLPFSTVGTLDRGKSKHRPRNDPSLLGGAHPLIQTGEVANSKGYITDYSATYSDLGLAQSKKWDAGTLCITIAANIAKTGILTFPACFPDSVVGFKPNNKVTVEFVQHWLGFLQKNLEANAPQAAQKNINLEILRGLSIPVPPKSKQEKFSEIVSCILATERKISTSENMVSEAFESLSQKAFQGKL